MSTVFKIVVGNSIRFVRAINKQAARVRAYKVWGIKADDVTQEGNNAPVDLGRYGYDVAAHRMTQAGDDATLKAMQKATPPRYSNTAQDKRADAQKAQRAELAALFAAS